MEFQGWSGGLALRPHDYLGDGASLGDVVRAAGPFEGEALYLFALGSAATMARLHLAGIAGLRLNPANVMIGARGQVSFAPGPRDSQFPSSDVRDWADVIVYAATGQWQSAEPGLDWLLPRLCMMIEDCHRRDPATRPTAVDLVHTLLGYPGTPDRDTLNDLLLEAENRTRPDEPQPEPPPARRRSRPRGARARGAGAARVGASRVWSGRVDLGGYGPVQLGPGRAESARAEQSHPRSDRGEQSHPRSDRGEPSRSRPSQVEQPRSRPGRGERGRAGAERAVPARNRSERAGSDDTLLSDRLEAGHAVPDELESDRYWSDLLGSGPVGRPDRRLFEPETLETPSAPVWRRPSFLVGVVIGALIVAALAGAVTLISGQAAGRDSQNVSLGEPSVGGAGRTR
ncbi:hypothetical protein [Nonomuraea zeae]|uniref:Protein kinase domain-containing protein n=1 Tax=Nonomuraea zeae TaxID=1642303 RepID=A0A5S4HJK5_9ACTN|nr:hypothetical protein [Nonomuraea zeae]TMR39420.1 hypothetical protein ETD85_01880 [Nonomuraea zeae]